ncbi:MAG TPA: hypothetical protein DCL44_10395 [Elusimicrobia bacterium]|nr:hypothetical protein [Elusimicrobiota bacterium]
MKIVKFDVLSATEENWDSYFRHLDEIRQECGQQDPQLPREQRKAITVSSHSDPNVRLYVFLMFPEETSGCAAGYAEAIVETPQSPTYNLNKHTGKLSLSVSQKHRRQGLATLLLKHVIEELAAKEPAVTELLTSAILESGKYFMNLLTGNFSLEKPENRLYIKDVDWDMINFWVEDGMHKNPGTTIKTVEIMPQEDIEEYSLVYNETANQQTFGNMKVDINYTPDEIRCDERKALEQGISHITIFLKENNGAISGLTEFFHIKEPGQKVTQNLTGVREQYRGRGLGKLLRACMLLHIRKFPGVEYVVTGNSDTNAPMHAINLKLGFKKHLPVKLYKLKIRGQQGPRLFPV